MPEHQKLWTRAYLLLCSSLFLVSGQQAMILVIIPLYVTHLGGSAFVAGLALFSFSLPSFLSRPIIGHWADTWSLVGVFTAGGLLLGLITPLYLIPVLAGVFLVSIVRGFGWGGAMTGSYAILAHVSPSERRGEASGYFSSVFSASNILFPAMGLWLIGASAGGYRTVFLLGSVFALASALMSQLWLRPAVQTPSLERSTAKIGPRGLLASAFALEPSVFLPTVLSLALNLAQPAVIAFLPLYARHQGIHTIAYYFVLSGVASLTIRPLLGRVDDRIGHGYSLVAGFAAQIVGILLIVVLGTLPAILFGGILNALGSAVCNAAVVGLAVEMAHPQRRGAGMATFTISFQMGNGIGSVLAGALVSLSGFGAMYAGTLAVLLCGLLLALWSWSKLGPSIAPALPESEAAG